MQKQPQSDVPGWVRQHIARHGLTQQRVASALGMSQQALSDRLTGRTAFTVADVLSLADYFDLTPGELLTPPAEVAS